MRGKTVLIVGGTSGIGQSCAAIFADRGWTVVICGRDVERGESIVSALAGQLPHSFIAADVCNEGHVENLFAQFNSRYGQLDAAFNCAGILGVPDNIPVMSVENFRNVLDVNLVGMFSCLRHEMKIMSEQKSGAIVNCSSIGGVVGMPGISAYVASKHAIIGLTKSAALEIAPAGVRVNSVSPGATMTPMQEGMITRDSGLETALIAQHPIGRIANPEEVAKAVYWLCSDDSSFVTGTNIMVDGGFSAK